MNKSITRKEIAEQLSEVRLKFEFFCQNYFVFSGQDSFKNDVSMFVRRDVIRAASAESFIFVRDFIELGTEKVRMVIMSPDLAIIYQD